MAATFVVAMKKFTNYGSKVAALVKDREPRATFSLRFITTCYGSNVTPGMAADIIVTTHRQLEAEKASRKIKRK
jgi:UDP-galactopyranose mutase